LLRELIYNTGMKNVTDPQEFRPELNSRRGELIAWGTALMVLAGWFILKQSDQPVLPVVPVLGILLLLAALSISLGNWMDRHTYVRLQDGGIAFGNGLRNVHLEWDQIKRVEVFPSNWGNKIHVLGEDAHFEFRTLGDVQAYGKTIGRVGFEDGERILKHILERSNLQDLHQRETGYYYEH